MSSRIPALKGDPFSNHFIHHNNNMLDLPWFYAINLPVVMREHKIVKLNSLALVVDEEKYKNNIWLKNSKKYFREDFNVSFETTVKFDAKYLDWGYKQNLTNYSLAQNVKHLVGCYANNSNSRSFYYYPKQPITTQTNMQLQQTSIKNVRVRKLSDSSSPSAKRQKTSHINNTNNNNNNFNGNNNISFQETEICSFCKQIVNYYETYRCGQCKEIYYCSKNCQTKDWNEHQKICNGEYNNNDSATIVKEEAEDHQNKNELKTDNNENTNNTNNKSMKDWNFYDVIFWLNRVDGGKLSGLKYLNLRKAVFDTKIKGNELSLITDMSLRCNMIKEYNDRLILLGLIEGLVMNDNFQNNIPAQTLNTNDIQSCHVDPVTFEIMTDPVILTVSGNTYDRKVIEQYIRKNDKDPITQQYARLKDIVPNKNLKDSIGIWIKQHSL